MKRIWWEQIKAVIRLEMKKTFFAKRGLWIHLVAALPVLLFVAYAIATSHQQGRRENLARQGARPLSSQDLMAVKPGMTSQKGVTIDVLHEDYHYSDGQNDLFVGVADDKVESVNLQRGNNLGRDSIMFAGVFQFFFLRLAVFFGCLGIFMNLFRGEILDRSLHFYFLAPIRREVLMVGKFLAGLLATCVIFVTSELLQNIAFVWHLSPGIRDLYLYNNHGMEHAAVYLSVTVLACVGYGAFFLVAGMLFKNPILPTVGILIWEMANPFLPALLKQFSVIYYLKALCPVNIPSPPGVPPLLALLISNPDPVSAPIAILGLLIVALIALYASSLQVRRMEINYTTE